MTKLFFIFRIAFSAIFKNPVRSFLSVIGIAIGIAAVIAMLGLGNGAQDSIQSNIAQLGSNTITISSSTSSFGPSAPSANGPAASNQASSVPLSQEDFDYLNGLRGEIQNVDKVAAVTSQTTQTKISQENIVNTQLQAVTSDYFSVQGLEIAEGDLNLSSSQPTIVLGYNFAEEIKEARNFNNINELVSTKLTIGETEYMVQGVLAESDSLLLATANSGAFTGAEYYFNSKEGQKYFSSIIFSVKNADDLGNTKAEIESKFREHRGLEGEEESNFGISTTEDLASTISMITNTLTLLLAGISGLSLLVGGIGISNIMLVTVTERTKEIGLRKAIGAKKIYILAQFLIEAVLLTLIGGVLGILMGYGLALGIAPLIEITAVIRLENILLATGISSFVGVFFGFIPAWNASRLSAVDALRYE